MGRTRQHLSPSRVRYEKSHPVISCRVSRSDYDRIEATKRVDGKSNTDILMLGVELIEPKVKDAEQLRKQARDQGYRKGYADAKARYLVTYSCSQCGEPIEVTTADEKASIRQHMQESGWAHHECLE